MATGADVATRARTQLLDPSPGVQWTDTELLSWVNDAQRAVVLLQPSALVASVSNHTLVAGALQRLPADAVRLMAAHYTTTRSARTALRMVSRDTLSRTDPAWYGAVASDDDPIRYCLYDADTPRLFYVHPGVPSSATVTAALEYAQQPAELTALANDLSLADVYVPTLVDYVLVRALSKMSPTNSGRVQEVQRLHEMFMTSLLGKKQADLGVAPATEAAPGRAS